MLYRRDNRVSRLRISYAVMILLRTRFIEIFTDAFGSDRLISSHYMPSHYTFPQSGKSRIFLDGYFHRMPSDINNMSHLGLPYTRMRENLKAFSSSL